MLQPILLYSGDTKNLLKDGDPYSKKSTKEEHDKDETILVTYDLTKDKVKDGVENIQKELMQQVMLSTPSTPMCSVSHRPVQLPEPLVTAGSTH
jgi:hypothetical protein